VAKKKTQLLAKRKSSLNELNWKRSHKWHAPALMFAEKQFVYLNMPVGYEIYMGRGLLEEVN